MLHISTDSVAFGNAHFGGGTGSQYLGNVACSGIEINLISCPHNFFVSCVRGHSQDVGVRCQGRFWCSDGSTCKYDL